MHHSHSHPHDTPLKELGFEEIIAELRSRGMRLTRNRVCLIEVLLEASSPLSLEQIQEASKTKGADPDYTTVFRLMVTLEELGIAHRVNLGQSCTYYELVDPNCHFDHIVCNQCGKVTVMEDDCPIQGLEKRIAGKYGYTQISHTLEFHGICPLCTTPPETSAS